jgi:hypothetical protein
MPGQTTTTSFDPSADYVAIEVQMTCELARESQAAPFVASLFRVETRWFEDDDKPDVIETTVCEAQFDSTVPAVFAAVDDWLIRGHRVRVPAPSWRHGDTGADTGLVFLLFGRALPVQAARLGSLTATG